MKRIAVLMTCYNRVRVTLRCLESLFQQKLPAGYEIEVYLVDDASPDDTGRIVKQKFPVVNLILGSGSLYWNRGMRLAWDSASAHCDYDYYLWLNDDVRLEKTAVADLLADHSRVNGVIVGTFAPDEKFQEVSYGATTALPTGDIPVRGDKGMNGNLVLVPKNIFETIGPNCKLFHQQYGDCDYGYQTRKFGFDYYASSRFSGICPEQPERYLHLKGRTLLQRLRLLLDPKGYCLSDAIIAKYRKTGICGACLSAMHIVLCVIFARETRR